MIIQDVNRPFGRALKAALSCLPVKNKFNIISHLAQQCGVRTLGVSGEYGVILSAVNDRLILRNYAFSKTWANRTNDCLLSFFRERGGHYIDVGANIGLTTIPVAQNAQVSCLAIEPEPINFANLSLNVMTNCRHGNVDTRRLAVFTSATTLELEIAAENLGDHRLRLKDDSTIRKKHDRPTILVKALPLDEIAIGRQGRLAVKIDTQGAEPFVVASGRETLDRAGLVIIEFSPYHMVRMGSDIAGLLAYLRCGFSTLRMAMGEAGELAASEPAIDICNKLGALAARHADDPDVYADIIAERVSF